MRHRVAEIDEETVTEILGDVALEAADDFAAHRLIGTDHSAQFLRIEIPGKGGRPDEVAEHDCQLPAFSIRNRTLGYRGGDGSFERPATATAESFTWLVRKAACRARSSQSDATRCAEPASLPILGLTGRTFHSRALGAAQDRPASLVLSIQNDSLASEGVRA